MMMDCISCFYVRWLSTEYQIEKVVAAIESESLDVWICEKKKKDDMGITFKWNQIKSKIQGRQPASATTDTARTVTIYNNL